MLFIPKGGKGTSFIKGEKDHLGKRLTEERKKKKKRHFQKSPKAFGDLKFSMLIYVNYKYIVSNT